MTILVLFGRMSVYRAFSMRQTAAAVLFYVALVLGLIFFFRLRVAHSCLVFGFSRYKSAKKKKSFLPLTPHPAAYRSRERGIIY